MTDPNNTAAAPQPGTPEYDAAMAAVGGPMNGRAPAAPQRPEHIPAKFWDEETGQVRVDDLAKSYAELERGRAGATAAKEETPGKLQIPGDDAAKAAVQDAGLNWDVLGDKLFNKGEIEETDYASLAKAGIPKEVVDQFIGNLKDAAAYQTTLAVTHVGGQEKMDALIAWAAANLTEPEKVEYNAMLGNRDRWRTGLDALGARMAAASKTAGEPTLTREAGGRAGQAAGAGYETREQMVADMSNPKYQTDPSFRRIVAEKMAVTSFRS